MKTIGDYEMFVRNISANKIFSKNVDYKTQFPIFLNLHVWPSKCITSVDFQYDHIFWGGSTADHLLGRGLLQLERL